MDKDILNKLVDLGFDEYFAAGWQKSGLTEYALARVVAEYRGVYRVRGVDREYLAKISGKQRFQAASREDFPTVGDWVALSVLPDERAIIHGILPRKTLLRKKYSGKQAAQIIAANIDFAFITQALDRDYNLNRFERYVVLANEGNITPVILLNKTDLIPAEELQSRINSIHERFGSREVIPTSTLTGHGLAVLQQYIQKGKTYSFLGSSGVGKSSLINALLGTDEIKVREISLNERGRHTTTTREMYFLKNGGIVIDNPGIREVGITDAETGIKTVFNEIHELSQQCKYPDCSHSHEPGCAVLQAVEEDRLDHEKYSNYVKLKQESGYYQMSELEKKRKDRKFGQFMKKAKEKLKEE